MKALIVGAGIAGLTTALSLHAIGAEVLIVDAAQELSPLGVGINLQPHAVRELNLLGLGGALEEIGIPPRDMIRTDRHGNQIARHARGRYAGHAWPQYSIHRGELQMLLLAAVVDRLGSHAVRTGCVFENYVEDVDAVVAWMRARAGGTPISIRADILVGADGFSSAVRQQLHPQEGAPRWSGIHMWRGLAEVNPFLTGRTIIFAGSHDHGRIVAYPISRAAENRGRALLNWVAEVRVSTESEFDPSAGSGLRNGSIKDVLPYFSEFRLGWLDIPRLIMDSEQLLECPMIDRTPLPWWSRDRTTLVGDAAHPMYPIGSNGASSAILDAQALAFELGRTDDHIKGLKAYEEVRIADANSVVSACHDMVADRLMDVVAVRAPDGFSNIEEVLTAEELSMLEFGVRSTTDTDPGGGVLGHSEKRKPH